MIFNTIKLLLFFKIKHKCILRGGCAYMCSEAVQFFEYTFVSTFFFFVFHYILFLSEDIRDKLPIFHIPNICVDTFTLKDGFWIKAIIKSSWYMLPISGVRLSHTTYQGVTVTFGCFLTFGPPSWIGFYLFVCLFEQNKIAHVCI